MQYLDGKTLQESIEGKPLKIPNPLELAIQIADALNADDLAIYRKADLVANCYNRNLPIRANINRITEPGTSEMRLRSPLIWWALTNQLLIDLACMIVGCLSLSNFRL